MADLFTGNHPCFELVAFQLKFLFFSHFTINSRRDKRFTQASLNQAYIRASSEHILGFQYQAST